MSFTDLLDYVTIENLNQLTFLYLLKPLHYNKQLYIYIYTFIHNQHTCINFTIVRRLLYETIHADVRSSLSRTVLYSSGVMAPATLI